MKELLTVVSLLLCGAVAEPPAPYPASGWRPNGPSFELPARVPAQIPQKQEYLPPVDPRRPTTPQDFDSGVDVSVQGLPTAEQQPIFQISPINGQQYAGPNYQADIRSLDQTLQQIQYQQQLEKQREFARQRQFEAARGNARANGLPNPQTPRQFVSQTPSTTTTTTTQKPEFRTESTTEPDLNEGEEYDDTKDDSIQKPKVSVEVTKQNIQEYPPELFLSPLAQFKIQPQFVQLGQLRAPLYYQPIQQEPERQSAGFDAPAHFAALPSVLAQQQLIAAQAQPEPLPQQAYNQNPAIVIARGQEQPEPAYFVPQEPLNQYQPANQFQPLAQPQVQSYPQFQAQAVVLPPQTANQLQPNQYVQPAQQPNQYAQPGQQPNQYAQPSQQPNQYAQPGQQPNQYAQPSQQPNQYAQPGQQPNQYAQPGQLPNQYAQPGQQPNQYAQPGQLPNQYAQPGQQPNQYAQPGQLPNQYAQPGQFQPETEEVDSNDDEQQVQQPLQPQPQFIYQQPYQPQDVYQTVQPQTQYQPQPQNLAPQPQLINYPAQDWNQYYRSQYPQQFPEVQDAQQNQGQGSLQSGLDVNQQGNGIDQKETEDRDDEQDGSRATAVATAFGARTQPRVFSQYGAPARPQANPGYATTTESTQEEVTENGPAIAQATAVATGARKSARLRSHRVRPIFTLDRSGHLVLAQEQ